MPTAAEERHLIPPLTRHMDGGKPRTAGASNFQRRTWDKQEYALKALERQERELPGGGAAAPAASSSSSSSSSSSAAAAAAAPLTVRDGRGEAAPYRDAAQGAAGPEGSRRAYLQARTEDLNLEAKVNKRKLVTEATPLAQVGGYFCELCQCTLTDSSTWLDHINGTKHQRRLGVSMRVEAAGVDAVRARLAAAKQAGAAAAAAQRSDAERREALAEFEGRVALAGEEDKARKRAKKEARLREREGGGGGGGGGGARRGAAEGGGGPAIIFGGGSGEGEGDEGGAAGAAGAAAAGAPFAAPAAPAAEIGAAAGGGGGQAPAGGGGGEEAEAEGGFDLSAIMGFGGFGGSRAN